MVKRSRLPPEGDVANRVPGTEVSLLLAERARRNGGLYSATWRTGGRQRPATIVSQRERHVSLAASVRPAIRRSARPVVSPTKERTPNEILDSARPTPRVVSAAAGRVLYVWQSDYPWDVRTEKVCAALSAAGFEVHLAARNRRREPVTEARPEGVVHRLPSWRWARQRLDAVLQTPAFFSPRWLHFLSSLVRRERPDVVIVRDLPLCAAAIWVGRRHRVPVILDMAENYPGTLRAKWDAGRQKPWDFLVRNPRLFSHLEDYCVRRVDHIIVVVEESADRLAARGVPRTRLHLVSNTPPAARAMDTRQTTERPPNAPLELVYLGIHTIERGLLELIDAIKILHDQHLLVRATIVGVGRDTDLLRARARALGLTDNEIVFTGYLQSHADALAVMARADVGVIASRKTPQSNSTIPNKLFDYMAAGLPVLTSDTAPCTRIVRATGAGEVFRAGDAADLAAAVRRLADPAVRLAAGEAGRRAILAQYNWERDAAVLCDLVGRVVARSGGAFLARRPAPAAALAGGGA
jgi:glycosyltransferase involved in cell wall biosynthesis